MSRKRKWKDDVWPVTDMDDLECCFGRYKGVMYNHKFLNSSFVRSMTYRTLENLIRRGALKFPQKIEEEN